MAAISDTPNLARLALQYGTINKDQYRQLTALYALRKKKEGPVDYGSLLIGQQLATHYQVGLLKLIQDYLVIKKKGEEFGRLAVEKGFVTQKDVEQALAFQRKEFKRARIKKLIGDILVDTEVISMNQKQQILSEQKSQEGDVAALQPQSKAKKSDSQKIAHPQGAVQNDIAPDLTEYEKQFLQIKALDKEFAATVVERGLASEQEVAAAQQAQEKEFQTKQHLRILGDIMVDMSFLTEEQKNVILKEQNRLSGREAASIGIGLVISKDKLSARIKITKDQFPTVTLSILKKFLENKGITKGIFSDSIIQCHLDRETSEFTVAMVNLSAFVKKKCRSTLLLDTELSERGEKRKGDVLCKQSFLPDSYEKPDVFGRYSLRPPGTDALYRPGSGSRISKDKSGIIAAKTGLPSVSVEGKLFIHPIIHVLEDADLRYGQLEAYADLSISGVLTGAYAVTAGHVKAREIRGANIKALGDIRSEVGITDAKINTQGDVYARYLHNCKIETFGNIYVTNEIIDSNILCSGMVDAESCRVITTRIYAKKGIRLAGVGSERTPACVMAAGTEHHILSQVKILEKNIAEATREIDDLTVQMNDQAFLSKGVFQKMVDLKLFHDRTKKKKNLIEKEYGKADDAAKKKEFVKMIHNYSERIEKSISTLKELNVEKKKYDIAASKLNSKIERLRPKAERQILEYRQDIAAYYEWAGSQKIDPEIRIFGKAFHGTHLKGVFSESFLEGDREYFVAKEVLPSQGDSHQISISSAQTL